MNSMTGFGHAEVTGEGFVISVEIKAYNNRYLDVSFAAPPYLSFYEPRAVEKVKTVASRGHLDISVKVQNLSGSAQVSLDEAVARSYAEAAKKVLSVCSEAGLDVRVDFSDIFSAPGVLNQTSPDAEARYGAALDEAMESALKVLLEFRTREGEATKRDLEEKIGSIEASLSVVKSRAGALESLIKENLLSRIHDMELDANYDESRILTEVAVMLVRYTINEELVRLDAHIREFRSLLDASIPVGKRLDFLSQEMNREINTIGSKSQMAEVNLEVVRMKDALENIREELRNVE